MKLKLIYLSFFSLLATKAVSAFAQTAPSGPIQTTPPPPQGAPGWTTIAFLVGTFFVMWLFIIRPQAKRQKEHKAFVDSLKIGQDVLTQGGLIGKITNVADSIVTIDFGSGPTRVLKSSIVQEIKAGTVTEKQ